MFVVRHEYKRTLACGHLNKLDVVALAFAVIQQRNRHRLDFDVQQVAAHVVFQLVIGRYVSVLTA